MLYDVGDSCLVKYSLNCPTVVMNIRISTAYVPKTVLTNNSELGWPVQVPIGPQQHDWYILLLDVIRLHSKKGYGDECKEQNSISFKNIFVLDNPTLTKKRQRSIIHIKELPRVISTHIDWNSTGRIFTKIGTEARTPFDFEQYNHTTKTGDETSHAKLLQVSCGYRRKLRDR